MSPDIHIGSIVVCVFEVDSGVNDKELLVIVPVVFIAEPEADMVTRVLTVVVVAVSGVTHELNITLIDSVKVCAV